MEQDNEIFQSAQERKKKLISTIVSMVVVILLAFVTAMLLKTYVIDTIPVGGDSMLPTLNGGVYVTDDQGKVVKTITKGDTLVLNKVAKIKRGDIVVFDVHWQNDPLVKRVIAVAGDTVEINNDGKVYVNGIALEEDYIQGATYTTNGEAKLSITVPDGHVFCLGDNRENSHDSRSSDIGAVPLDKVRGKCFLIIGPQGKIRTP